MVDGQNVLSHHPDKKDDHGAQEQHADEERRQTCLEAVPPDQLHDQIDKGDHDAEKHGQCADKGGETQSELRIGGDGKHGCIVQLVEVVAGLSGSPLRLVVGDLFPAVTQLRHDAAQEGRRVIQLPKHVDKVAVIKAEPCEMFDLVHLGEALDPLVILAPEPVHEGIFRTVGLDANSDLISFFPCGDVLRDHLRRVLEVRRHEDGGVAGGLQHRVIRGVELAEVLRVKDGLDPFVRGAEDPDAVPCRVAGIVVDQDQFIIIARKLVPEHLRDRLRDGAYIFFLVVAGNYHTDLLHTCLQSGVTMTFTRSAGFCRISSSPSAILSNPES